MRNFVLESVVIGGAGALAGMALAGTVTTFLIFADIQMPAPPGRSDTYPLLVNFSAALYLFTGFAVVAVSALVAYAASARAARKPITEALAHV